MRKVPLYVCEGCRQVFRPEDLRHGQIGPHTWTSGFGPWHSAASIASASEEDCRIKLAAWQRDEAAYHQEQDMARRQRQVDEDRLVAVCRTDDSEEADDL